MRIYRLPVRETCRASNAFNLHHALITAFRAESTAAAATARVTVDTEKDPDRWNKLRIHKENGSSYEEPFPAKPTAKPVAQVGGGFAEYEEFNASIARKPRAQQGVSKARGSTTARTQDLNRRIVHDSTEKPTNLMTRHGYGLKKRHIPDAYQSRRQISGGDGNPRARDQIAYKHASVPKQHASQSQATPQDETSSPFHPEQTDSWKMNMQQVAKLANEMYGGAKKGAPRKATEMDMSKFGYHPKVISPRGSPLDESEQLVLPWEVDVVPREGNTPDKMQMLASEIARFHAFAQPTSAEIVARRAVADELRTLIQGTLQHVQTNVFGSEVTGLASATSDIDIRIYNSKEWVGKRNYFAFGSVMKVLAHVMEDSSDWICVSFRHGKYPIINAQHKASGIDVQLVSSPSTKKQEEWTAKYLADMPHLRSLYFVLRTMLGIRGLVDVFNGGTGSYGLFMMLVASLRRRSSNPATEQTSAEQLLRFFEFYSDLAMDKHGVTVEPVGKLFQKHDGGDATPIQSYIQAAHRREDPVRAGQWAIGQRRALQPYLLCLQDPADPKNDLGRKSNAMKHIVKTIRHHHHMLSKQIHGKPNSNLLLPIVGRCHEVYAEQRRRVEDYGAEVMKRADITNEADFQEVRVEERERGTEKVEMEERSADVHEPVQAASSTV